VDPKNSSMCLLIQQFYVIN
ncbi:unnamed protein product, partial [Adineta steineri]